MASQNQTVANHQVYHQTQTAPIISTKDWMLTILVLAIPLINIVMLFVWAFGSADNPNKANFAKATLLWMLIVIGFYVLLTVFSLILGIAMSL